MKKYKKMMEIIMAEPEFEHRSRALTRPSQSLSLSLSYQIDSREEGKASSIRREL